MRDGAGHTAHQLLLPSLVMALCAQRSGLCSVWGFRAGFCSFPAWSLMFKSIKINVLYRIEYSRRWQQLFSHMFQLSLLLGIPV